ncbi:uncharacterized protein LOC123226698 [Mangifera indica]|uniref:uncharacterized protein LOC123226698 n=1 Tax=Mangifera indica TaxID=29780 RepID=UPI001CFAEA39|nr:uncharacterized protein LOC123226698 [Mangifera indica]XP_044507166.1 uncharacterized protein LOC123226698 [Mangifera indica]
MHTIKHGWIGQTFALAKRNESEGRKSRIRRSKEERKTMVESFIKKYQSSNNGNFPSLNLTHKEVGGSFYTVRELVREIIQENRVLGPAQLTPDELNMNQFDEQYPLGSIAKEPQAPLNIILSASHDQGASKEPVAIFDGLCSEHEKQRFDNEGVINGGQVVIEIEESAKRTSQELQTSKGSQFMPNHNQGFSKELVAISDELCSENEKQKLDNEGLINGSQVVVEVEESAKRTSEELQTSKPSEPEERVEKVAGDNEGVIYGSQVVVKVEESAKRTSKVLQTSKPSEAQEIVEKIAADNEGIINESRVVVEVEESAKRTSEKLQTSKPSEAQERVEKIAGHNEGAINESQVIVVVEESAERTSEESQTSKPSEAEERVEKLAAARARATLFSAEVVVEEFPPRSVPKTAESSSERPGVENLTETSKENEIEKLVINSDNGSAPLDQINSLEKIGENPSDKVLYKNSDMVENSPDLQVKISNFSSTRAPAPKTLVNKEVEVEFSDNDALTSEMPEKAQSIDDTKEVNAPNGKIPSCTYSSRVQSRTAKETVFENKVDIQQKDGLQKGSNPKLERIKIESWDGASRNCAEKETNPLLDAFKSFINAFIKFWSE